jgi:predicted signal transduction protein with EAL and GGDEF domain
VARRLQRERRGGLLARLGSNEFGLVVTDLSSTEEATSIALGLAEALHRPMLIHDTLYELEISIGVACVPQDGREEVEILRRAEVALHRAKGTPGAALRYFEPAMDQSIREHALLERDLRAAIDTGAVQPYYQPIVELSSRRLIGFEALARWTHPTLGPVAPDRFTRVAERCGLMDALSEHLLRQAVRAALNWPEQLRLAFNISAAQLNSEWPQRLLFVLREAGLVPQRVELEVTETALVHDLRRAQTALSTLRGGGVRIALDDFGTGASSLHHLREFKVDTLKIDRVFVAALEPDSEAAALIRGVIGLAHGLGLSVTAEGVERPDQAATLLALRCDHAQGYLYGAARPVDQAAILAEERRPR